MREFIHKYLGRRVTDETGASAVEYGLLVAGIAALIVLIVFAFGGLVGDIFEGTCDNIAADANSVVAGQDCNG